MKIEFKTGANLLQIAINHSERETFEDMHILLQKALSMVLR